MAHPTIVPLLSRSAPAATGSLQSASPQLPNKHASIGTATPHSHYLPISNQHSTPRSTPVRSSTPISLVSMLSPPLSPYSKVIPVSSPTPSLLQLDPILFPRSKFDTSSSPIFRKSNAPVSSAAAPSPTVAVKRPAPVEIDTPDTTSKRSKIDEYYLDSFDLTPAFSHNTNFRCVAWESLSTLASVASYSKRERGFLNHYGPRKPQTYSTSSSLPNNSIIRRNNFRYQVSTTSRVRNTPVNSDAEYVPVVTRSSKKRPEEVKHSRSVANVLPRPANIKPDTLFNSHSINTTSPLPTPKGSRASTPKPRRTASAPSKVHESTYASLPDYSPDTSTLLPGKPLKADWKGQPMDLTNDPLVGQLHPAEIYLASCIRLSCELYLDSKRRLFAEKVHRLKQGLPFRRTDAQKACRIDVNKASRLFVAYEKVGWLDDKMFKHHL
ncbi:hypothetical protein NADFUDRAFT_45383 [Nadsonia fulvescens var. elongata DSM 6958]|uniref:SWIRM domain-containing protein n=1 Tax=Nadsonia fulvescens var. elongata DSM 6958 TaxID=857566 RepID=A0A1E3PQU3_9ASCO|nr:hypothetical protein NADFUDRAFT_45383 [Nadsonia fulvescens var. elongata DSM 6958]